jgi:hypothetical protein
LHVDYLGNEEILIVACDDGDVIGYRVPEIHRAVDDRKDLPPSSEADLTPHVRVFLHINAGSSAWGIAVHREARLIAISANTHKVTVIAYALSNPPDSDLTGEERVFPSSSVTAEEFLSQRRHDRIITLASHANIPSISFDNNDPSGRWLFASSIDGQNYLWDLSQPDQAARVISLGHCVGVQDPTTIPRRMFSLIQIALRFSWCGVLQ